MYRKIYECKFPSGAVATSAIDNAGWAYDGMHGLFSKYHRYFGGRPPGQYDKTDFVKYRIRLYDNGKVELYVNSAIGILSTTGLPFRVWRSLEIYNDEKAVFERANGELVKLGFEVQWIGNRKFQLNKIIRTAGEIGYTSEKTNVPPFQHPDIALEWVKANRQRA